MTALIGFLVTALCLTSMFCIVKLIARYRSGETPIPQVPRSPVPWDGMTVASLLCLFLLCQGLCVAAAQAMFPAGDQSPQVMETGNVTTDITVVGSESADKLGYILLANAVAMLVFTCVAALFLWIRGASWEDLGFCDPKPREGLRLACVTWVIYCAASSDLGGFSRSIRRAVQSSYN